MDDGRPRVVVGVDGSPASRTALVHALVRAARLGADLHVVATFPVQGFWVGGWVIGPVLEAVRRQLTDRVQELLGEVTADPEVTAEPATAHVRSHLRVVVGPPGPHLVDASTGAALLVVGNAARGAVRGVVLGSVALHCLARARCPVLLVRAGQATDLGGRVVVGVDDGPSAREALRVAVDEAVARNGDLVVVAGYSPAEHWVDLGRVGGPTAVEVQRVVQRGVDALVTQVLADRPGDGRAPAVRTAVADAPAVDLLVRESVGAELLVLGSHGHGEVRGLLVGAVGLACAARAGAPLLVVRPPRAEVSA